MVWRKARPDSDFAMVEKPLAEILALVREQAAAKADAFGLPPYEALLDQYEPGARTASIDALFDDLGGFLPDFLQKVLDRQAAVSPPVAPEGPFDIGEQRALAVRLMEHIGFDFDHGRLDISLHPFCGGVPDDVRITTRYFEHDFAQSLMGVLHETGHAMYERNLPAAWRLQPVGEARGMAMHESQSLLVEMQVCRGPEFLGFAAPLMRDAFSGEGAAWDTRNLSRLYTKVEPGFIRVDADEVTYPAHVILRYRLERALIAGDMRIADIPTAWNEGMEELLGITPPSDREGCLQDIHWFHGSFGYFPTYTMGALAAAQIFAAATKAEPGIKPAISRGDFAPLMRWLAANIHGRASIGSTDDILTEATGAPLGTAAFKTHLEARYFA
jgi:carboxypeptidase Taq